MERRGTNGYVWMGTAVRFLRDASAGWHVFGEGLVASNIDDFADRLAQNNMHVTLRVCRDLLELRKGWDAERDAALRADPGSDFEATRKLDANEAKRVSALAGTIQTCLLAESVGHQAFITRDKRFAIDNLLEDVGNLMPAGAFNDLPAIAQYDFGQAGRCIAFELPTAAAFHLMRGTEATLGDFYRRIVKRDRVKPLMWGPMTNHLRQRRDTPPDVLMNNLDNIRRSFRNPTQHPDKIYDIDEAQDLMALSIDVIVRMQKHLKDVGK